MTTDPKTLAAFIVDALGPDTEIGADGYCAPWSGPDGNDDLRHVTIDGHYDLEALAAAIIEEVKR